VVLTDTQFSFDVGHKWYRKLRTNGYLSFMVISNIKLCFYVYVMVQYVMVQYVYFTIFG